MTTAVNDAADRAPATSVSGFIGDGQAVTRSVYSVTSPLDVGGSLILNAQGSPDAVVIFQAGSTLTTNSASRMLLANGERACNCVLANGQFRDARH